MSLTSSASARPLRRVTRGLGRGLVVACAAALTLGLSQPVATSAPTTAPATATATSVTATATTERSVGYVAYWDQARALRSVAVAGSALTEVSPSWYTPNTDGSVTVQEAGRVDDSAAAVTAMRAGGARVLPAVANYRDKQWDRAVVTGILADPARRRAHVSRIRELVRLRGFDGIDVDYEHLAAEDRSGFTAFVTELAAGLHADAKLLAVTLHPKSAEPGPQPKNQAQDYAAVGRVADEVRIMLYDYHWDTSAPGALAPISWVRKVMTWAATQVPSRKLVLGVGTYGYDWVGTRGTSLMWAEITRRAGTFGAVPRYDTTVQAPWFRYVDSRGAAHTVWYEDARSIAAKRAVVRELGLGGMHYWRLGGEDPGTWRLG
jgi:spore germination protein YaaH